MAKGQYRRVTSECEWKGCVIRANHSYRYCSKHRREIAKRQREEEAKKPEFEWIVKRGIKVPVKRRQS